jgi:hypothetical protein
MVRRFARLPDMVGGLDGGLFDLFRGLRLQQEE